MKILQITSMLKPYRCGIGDYTWRLAISLAEKKSFQVKILAKTSEESSKVINVGEWNLLKILKIWSEIKSFAPDIVHLQYPGKGLGYFIVLPFLIIFLKLEGFKIVLTLHEYEISSPFRKLSSLWIAALSSNLVFTNDREKEKISDKLFFRGKKSAVIGLAPNIYNSSGTFKRIPDKINKVATFGLFYPGRMMENVLNVFGKLNGKYFEFYVIGSYDELHYSYFEKVKKEADSVCKNKKVNFILNKDEKFLKSFLGEMELFVLLYSDGASFKRTSLMSAMSFGIPVVSNLGKATPIELIDSVNIMLGENEDEIVKKTNGIIHDPILYSKISYNSYLLGKKFSWSEIAIKHTELYDSTK